MKLINADKYQKDIEHYRNFICYQRNVTMDDCVKILDKQEDVLDKIRAEIIELRSRQNVGVLECLDIIDKYKTESEDEE